MARRIRKKASREVVVDSSYGSLAVCGVYTSFIIFSIGLACLIISIVSYFEKRSNNAVDCGANGRPPLIEWVFGTGVAFSIISAAFFRVSSGRGDILAHWILGATNLFVFIWAIVGVFSLFKYDKSCLDTNPKLFIMAFVAVVSSFIVFCCGGFIEYNEVVAV